jgi:ABC-type multidrug transport system fused ATPase/permease subunit
MATDQFTTEETAKDLRGNFPLMLRYLREVPIVAFLIVPNLLLATVAAGAYQLFVWASGTLAECEGRAVCTAVLPVTGWEIDLTTVRLGLLTGVIFCVRAFQWTMFETGGQMAALPLFRRMIGGLGRVRTTFFDEYPSGKIINRVVRDFEQLKMYAPIRIGDASIALVELTFATIVIGLVSPVAALVAIPAFFVFLYIQSNVAPMLQRTMMLRSVRFGEVLHRETDVIEGARSYLLYGYAPQLLNRFKDSVFRYMQMHFLRGQIEAWGRFWCDVSVALYSFLTLIAVAVGLQSGTVTPVLGAVVVTAVFRLGGLFGWLTWSLGFLFETAGHARRVFDYVDLPREESEEGVAVPAVQTLTGEGDLHFVNYSMSYRPNSPLILDDLTLTVARGSKVGVVGRTGAGKTSLLQALFRMVHVRQGDIRVGTESIYSVSARDARRFFAVVPQDPYLFEGTVRSNLDRYGESDDGSLRKALALTNLTVDLDDSIREGGSNLSLGQRQLLCLARVILSKAPFVVMDEPTSGVDTITDAVIQAVLRTVLADRTVLTIAHRLETLSRVDRVIELRNGKIVRDGPAEVVVKSLTSQDLA